MNRFAFGFVVFLLLMAGGRLHAASPPVCGDFLRQAGLRLAALDYKSCQPAKSAQIRVLRATYEVRGVNAASVEAQLVKRYGMGVLKFNCCLWEPTNGQRGWSKTRQGYDLDIGMGSEETVYNKRSDWPKIKVFFVVVDLLLEQP